MANIHEIKTRFEGDPSRVTDDELEQLLASTADDIARYVIHGDIYPERVPEYAPPLETAKRLYIASINEAATRALAGSSFEHTPTITRERPQDDGRPAHAHAK